MSIQLDALELFAELSRRAQAQDPIAVSLRAHLLTMTPRVESALNDVRVYFRHFTDHSIRHSLRIVHNIARLLTKEQLSRSAAHHRDQCITTPDLFLLVAASLVHDLGMVVSESEFNRLAEDPEFRNYIDAHFSDDVSPTSDDWYRRGIPRLALAEFVRRRHPQRSLEMVLDAPILPDTLREDAPTLTTWLARIAASHGEEFEKLSTEQFPTHVELQLPGGMQESCNPRFVATCLRIGDLLDIGTARACPLLRRLSEPFSLNSLDHWDQYANVYVENLRPNSEIRLAGECPTQDAERILRDWYSCLEAEAAAAVALQNLDEERYRLSIGRISYQVEPKKDPDGRPAYEFLDLRFNLDERLVLERLLGRSLYGRPELALRELIQNAVDAQRARLVHDISSIENWRDASDQERATLLRDKIWSCSGELPITVRLENQPNSSQHRWLSICDSGIGMTRDAISKYLLKVGRSRWSMDPSVSRLGLGSATIGTFGIGFVATLMVADRVIIETRSILPNEEGIRATIYAWDGYLATERIERSTAGTCISLRLSTTLPSSLDSMAAMLSSLVPNPEFPVEIEGDQSSTRIPRLAWDDRPRSGHQSEEVVRLEIDRHGSSLWLMRPGVEFDRRWVGDRSTIARLGDFGSQVVVCQDGLAVGEMHYPSTGEPEGDLLASRRLLLDLRGPSRVPLDLSRNLVESGSAAFWATWSKRSWDAISAYYASSTLAKYALEELADREVSEGKADPFRFAAKGPRLLRGLDELIDIDQIRWPTNVGNLYSPVPDERSAIWIQPSPEQHTVVVALINPDLLGLESGDLRRSELHTVGSEERWAVDFTRRVNQQWRTLCGHFPFLSAPRHGELRLSRSLTKAGECVDRLIGFRLSSHWLCLRDPANGALSLFPAIAIDSIVEQLPRLNLSLADGYLFLISNLFPYSRDEWGTNDWGPLSDCFKAAGERSYEKLGDTFHHLLAELYQDVSSSDEVGDSEGDDPNGVGQYAHLLDVVLESFGSVGESYRGVASESGLLDAVPTWERQRRSKQSKRRSRVRAKRRNSP